MEPARLAGSLSVAVILVLSRHRILELDMAHRGGIAILDFGGQYVHLIATKVRALGVYAEIREPDDPVETFRPYDGVIISGSPSLSVTCGFTDDGMPIGMMITGKAYRDDVVLSVGDAYERVAGWQARRPMAVS